jgi:hypothetical protein
MNTLKPNEPLPQAALVETALATQEEKTQIILAFSDLTNIGDVDKLTDENLFKHMKHGLRLTGQLLQPFCASFLRRFKQAKKETGSFHGFKDFDRAARAKTGYTGQQIRNLAAGTPTPVKKATVKPLSAAEKKFRVDAQALQEKVDAAVTARIHARKLSEIESQAAQAAAASVSPAVPVVIVSQQKPFTANDATALDEAIVILQALVFTVGKSNFDKKDFKAAVAFLKSRNAFNVPQPTPPSPRKGKTGAKKSVSESEIKAEPSQAKPVPKLGDFVTDGSMTIGHMYSENSKGTAPEIEFVTPEQHEDLQRGTGVV